VKPHQDLGFLKDKKSKQKIKKKTTQMRLVQKLETQTQVKEHAEAYKKLHQAKEEKRQEFQTTSRKIGGYAARTKCSDWEVFCSGTRREKQRWGERHSGFRLTGGKRVREVKKKVASKIMARRSGVEQSPCRERVVVWWEGDKVSCASRRLVKTACRVLHSQGEKLPLFHYGGLRGLGRKHRGIRARARQISPYPHQG